MGEQLPPLCPLCGHEMAETGRDDVFIEYGCTCAFSSNDDPDDDQAMVRVWRKRDEAVSNG